MEERGLGGSTSRAATRHTLPPAPPIYGWQEGTGGLGFCCVHRGYSEGVTQQLLLSWV